MQVVALGLGNDRAGGGGKDAGPKGCNLHQKVVKDKPQ